jgi:hypothetical protein
MVKKIKDETVTEDMVTEPDENYKPIEIIEEQKEEPVEETEKPIVKSDFPDIRYREVVYLGTADEAERIGAVTGNSYVFTKDSYKMPKATSIDERDYPGIISEKGRGCARRDPQLLFMSKREWDLELEQARIINNS